VRVRRPLRGGHARVPRALQGACGRARGGRGARRREGMRGRGTGGSGQRHPARSVRAGAGARARARTPGTPMPPRTIGASCMVLRRRGGRQLGRERRRGGGGGGGGRGREHGVRGRRLVRAHLHRGRGKRAGVASDNGEKAGVKKRGGDRGARAWCCAPFVSNRGGETRPASAPAFFGRESFRAPSHPPRPHAHQEYEKSIVHLPLRERLLVRRG
jgi:hypothetical protein